MDSGKKISKPTIEDPPLIDSLFTYGSLMCADIMALVAGSELQCTPAVLPGYRRFQVRDEHYPGVMADKAGVVPGMVYHHISTAGWSRLDRFEGAMYDRLPVTVRYDDSSASLVYCYVFRAEFHHRMTTVEWDFSRFLESGKNLFQQHYCGFQVLDKNACG